MTFFAAKDPLVDIDGPPMSEKEENRKEFASSLGADPEKEAENMAEKTSRRTFGATEPVDQV